jgi:hypothetical protein
MHLQPVSEDGVPHAPKTQLFKMVFATLAMPIVQLAHSYLAAPQQLSAYNVN